LLNLCWELCIKWIDEDQDLTRQFNDMAAKICSGQGMPHKTFRELVFRKEGFKIGGCTYQLISLVKQKPE